MRIKSLSAIGLSILGAVLVVLVVVTVAAGFEDNSVPPTRLRVAHVAPFADSPSATAVDVKIDGTQVLTAFQYLSSTTYFETTSGDHSVQVFPSGTMTPAISTTVNLASNKDHSAFAIGGANGYTLTLKPELDNNNAPASGNGKVRFGHLAPFAAVLADTEAEIRTDDGALVAGPFLYGEIDTMYAELPANTYDLKVVTTADGQTIINLAPFALSNGDILYAVAVGDGTNQDPGVFAYPTDKIGGLLPTEDDAPRLRVAHLAPFTDTLPATAVDVKIDGTQVLTGFEYLDSTKYFTTTAGQHSVQVFPSGSMTPAISTTVDLANNVDYSAFAIGGANGYALTLKPQVDNNNAPVTGTGKVRFGHLAPFAPVLADTEAEIRTDDGALVAGPFLYGEIDSVYIELPASIYDLKVVTTANGQTLINLAPFQLLNGDIIYALAVGDGSNQDPGVFAYPTDDIGGLLPTEDDSPRLRVAHLASFADTLPATAVDVKIDGTQVLTAFQYLSSTTYFETKAGEHLVQVFPSGSMTPAISTTVDLANNMDYSAFAIGGANGFPLTLKPELDNNNAPASGNGKVRFGHLAPFAPVLADTEAEIRTDDGALVAGPFLYGEIDTVYAELPAGTYDLWVTAVGFGQVLINLSPFSINDGDILYAVATGDGSNQELGVFAYPTDKEGFLLPTEPLFKLYWPIIFS